MRQRHRKVLARTASLLCAGLAVAAGTPAAATTGPAASPEGARAVPAGRIGLPGGPPPWATAQADQGQAPAGTTVTAHVYLAGRDSAGLQAEARSVSDPSSAHYGRYLTPAEVRARYGATSGQQAAVRGWLTGAGFKVTAADVHQLTVQGSPKAVGSAFGTALHRYRKDGHMYTAPATAVSVPADLADQVLTVTGLEDTPHLATPKSVRALRSTTGSAAAAAPAAAPSSVPDDTLPPPTAAFVNAPPSSTAWGDHPATGVPRAYGGVPPYAVHGYTGRQLRGAYGVTGSGLTGRGVTVAVVDAYHSPTLTADATAYARRNGDAPYRPGQLTTLDAARWTDTDACGADGWYGEQSLDVEAVHALAQDADIAYVGAGSCDDPDLLAALNRIVDHRLADIVSDSWGESESSADPAMDPAYDMTFATGALEGVGFYFSSGDDGDDKAATGTKQTESPASRPWATSVGGTSLAVGPADGYRWETGWGTDSSRLDAAGTAWSTPLPGAFDDGAGGGVSMRAAQPWYQRGSVPAGLSEAGGGPAMRTVPDVAAVADPTTGFLVGQTQTWPDGTVEYGEFRIGGTSLAAPVLAGVQALAQQAQGYPIGFANPALYAHRHSATLHDVTDHPLGARELAAVRVDYSNHVDASAGTYTTLQTLGHDSSLAATAGYDEVTGLGSPSPAYLRSFQQPPGRG
jgi:subtilase family serine protease